MADAEALAARRERRRRRILDNAESRMKCFTNLKKTVRAASVADPLTTVALRESHSPFHREFIDDKSNPGGEFTTLKDKDPLGKDDDFEVPPALNEDELFGPRFASNPTDTGLEQPKKLTSYRKGIILLLGIAVRYINLIFENGDEIVGFDLSYLHLSMIFVPFLIYEITEYIVCPPTVEMSKTLNLMLMLNNISGRRLSIVVITANHVLRFLKEVAVYFFAYIFLDMVFAIFRVDDDVV
ncbi:uncharacterized protein [Atheta coriaria]|uniref:uncharacterized protein n=1 Tax=Dalotia coriaria TaxID=877792 RepID=UPI0031F3D808